MRVIPRKYFDFLKQYGQKEQVPPVAFLLDHVVMDEDGVVLLRDEERGAALGGVSVVPRQDPETLRTLLQAIGDDGVIQFIQTNPDEVYMAVRVPFPEGVGYRDRPEVLEERRNHLLDIFRLAGAGQPDPDLATSIIRDMVSGGLVTEPARVAGEDELRVEVLPDGLDVVDDPEDPFLKVKLGDRIRYVAVATARVIPEDPVPFGGAFLDDNGGRWWRIQLVYPKEDGGIRLMQVFIHANDHPPDQEIQALVGEVREAGGVLFFEDFVRTGVFFVSMPMNATLSRLRRVRRGLGVSVEEVSRHVWVKTGEEEVDEEVVEIREEVEQ